MKYIFLFLALTTLRAEEPKSEFHKIASGTHGASDAVVERYRNDEGTQQIWLASVADPAKRHLLYEHHRDADVVFSQEDAWLVINDHFGSAGSASFLYHRESPLVYKRVADLSDAAWKFFGERNGLNKATPLDHRYIDAICVLGRDDSPVVVISLHGHEDDHSHALWYCLYDLQKKSFSTSFDALNKQNTKLKTK